MNIYATIILCFIPFITVFLLFTILISEITIVKELFACLVGLLALIPIAFIQFFTGDFFVVNNQMVFSILIRAIFLYGIVEEGIKCCLLFIFPMKSINLKLVFVYSILAGLFLGSFESVVYVINSIQNASLRFGEFLLYIMYLRTFASLVFHSLCAGLLGLFVFSVKRKVYFWRALIYAILIHGLYDFFAIMPGALNIFSYVIIILLVLECRINYVKISERIKKNN